MASVSQAPPAPTAIKPVKVKWVTPRGIIALVVPIAGLIIALVSGNLLLLDYVHVLSGGTWTGIDLFMGFILSDVLRSSSVMVRAEIARKVNPSDTLLHPFNFFGRDYCRLLPRQQVGSIQSTLAFDNLCGDHNRNSPHPGARNFPSKQCESIVEVGKQSPDFNRISRLMMLNFKLSWSAGNPSDNSDPS